MKRTFVQTLAHLASAGDVWENAPVGAVNPLLFRTFTPGFFPNKPAKLVHITAHSSVPMPQDCDPASDTFGSEFPITAGFRLLLAGDDNTCQELIGLEGHNTTPPLKFNFGTGYSNGSPFGGGGRYTEYGNVMLSWQSHVCNDYPIGIVNAVAGGGAAVQYDVAGVIEQNHAKNDYAFDIYPAMSGPQWFTNVAVSGNGDVILACCGWTAATGQVWLSKDAGVTWVLQRALGFGQWLGLSVDADGSCLWASCGPTASGVLWESQDGGTTWTSRQPGGFKNYEACAMDKADGSNGVCVAYSDYPYTTTNSGASWTKRQPAGAVIKLWRGCAVSNTAQQMAVCASGDFIYTSNDWGVNWTKREPGGVGVAQLWYDIAMSADGAKICAVEQGGYLWTSLDTGATWTKREPAGAGIVKNYTAISCIGDMSVIIACDATTLYVSGDSGATWVVTAGHASGLMALSCDAGGAVIAHCNYASNGRVSISTDTAVTWSDVGPFAKQATMSFDAPVADGIIGITVTNGVASGSFTMPLADMIITDAVGLELFVISPKDVMECVFTLQPCYADASGFTGTITTPPGQTFAGTIRQGADNVAPGDVVGYVAFHSGGAAGSQTVSFQIAPITGAISITNTTTGNPLNLNPFTVYHHLMFDDLANDMIFSFEFTPILGGAITGVWAGLAGGFDQALHFLTAVGTPTDIVDASGLVALLDGEVTCINPSDAGHSDNINTFNMVAALVEQEGGGEGSAYPDVYANFISRHKIECNPGVILTKRPTLYLLPDARQQVSGRGAYDPQLNVHVSLIWEVDD